MKVGDYVRVKSLASGIQYIGELVNINEYREPDMMYCVDIQKHDVIFVSKEMIVKSSSNILELLEEHDFITIEYYSLRYDERVERIFEVNYKNNEFTTLKNAYCDFRLRNNEFNDNDKALEPIIKSIVTKEQFESIQYKVD